MSVVSPPPVSSLGGCSDECLNDDTSLCKIAKDSPLAYKERTCLGAGEVRGGRFGTSREAIQPSSKTILSNRSILYFSTLQILLASLSSWHQILLAL